MPTEDELAKKTIVDAIWTWSGRILALAVMFGAGWFTAYWSYGSGPAGAPALRFGLNSELPALAGVA